MDRKHLEETFPKETPNYWSKQIQVQEDEIYILGGNDGDAKYEGKL
jgi:hypothetical protein